MSRHHILPPIVYVPDPRPKKIENRKRRIQVGGAGMIDELEEAGETYETTSTGRSNPVFNKPLSQNFPAIEGSESKPHYSGRLSDGTLKAMLQAQELK
jgi:hypothetical protein